jgi:hypothetical protein
VNPAVLEIRGKGCVTMIPKGLARRVTQILRHGDWTGPAPPAGACQDGCTLGEEKSTVAMKNIGSAAKAARAMTGSTKAIAAAAG